MATLEPLDPDRAEPLYMQLAGRLAAQISSGELPPGRKVPSEAELMNLYKVSRITVRQAVQLLAHNGKVTSHRGKGTFVKGRPLQQDLNMLQGFQEALRRQGVEPQTELLEFSAFRGLTDSQLPEGLDFPVRLRRRYCLDGTPFALVEAYLPREAAALGEARARQLAVYEIVEQYLGLKISRADVAIRCAKPKAQVAKDLGLPSRSNVLVMERTSYSSAGLPCEFMRIYIVSERYTFNLSVQGPLEIARAVQPDKRKKAGTQA